MIRFQIASEEDAEVLRDIQVRAFQSQNPPKIPKLSGPPGYDSVDWQVQMMQRAQYIKVVFADEIVGGIVLAPEEPDHCHVERIFLDPPFHGRGIGTQAFAWIEITYSRYSRWTLRTPAFHIRNQCFYERLGYVKSRAQEITPGFVMIEYEKRLRNQA